MFSLYKRWVRIEENLSDLYEAFFRYLGRNILRIVFSFKAPTTHRIKEQGLNDINCIRIYRVFMRHLSPCMSLWQISQA
jgi:hypothetical protein